MDVNETAGTYHYMTDDEVVVSWMEYGNSMNAGVCFQLIMHKDGSFKFQYKGYDENSIIFNTFGLAGACNEGGSEYFVIPDRFIKFGNAVQFSPASKSRLPSPSQARLARYSPSLSLLKTLHSIRKHLRLLQVRA